MISLSSEITDSKGRRAPRGWLCFDRECAICTSLVRRFRHALEERGFGIAALQDPRVSALLGLPPDELPHEMRVITTNGEHYGGTDAIVFLAKQIWWAWPIYAIAHVPGARHVLRAAYHWFANRRSCLSPLNSSPRKDSYNNSLERAKGEQR